MNHIKNGMIDSAHLAANGGTLPDDKTRIDTVLQSNDDSKIDGAVRDILRRFSGLPEERDNRSVYTDCPFGRAWWRGYLPQEVQQESDSDSATVHEVFCSGGGVKEYWEGIITLTVSKNSVLGDTKIRSALISCLTEFVNNPDHKGLYTNANLKKLTRMIGTRQAMQELGIQDINAIKTLINDEMINRVIA